MCSSRFLCFESVPHMVLTCKKRLSYFYRQCHDACTADQFQLLFLLQQQHTIEMRGNVAVIAFLISVLFCPFKTAPLVQSLKATHWFYVFTHAKCSITFIQTPKATHVLYTRIKHREVFSENVLDFLC